MFLLFFFQKSVATLIIYCNNLYYLFVDEAEHGPRVHALPGQRKAQEDRHTRPGEGWVPGGEHCQVDPGAHRGPGK